MERGISTTFAVGFYTILAFIAWVLANFVWSLDLLVWHDLNETPVWLDAAIGAGGGLLVVIASNILEEYAEWAKTLGREFKKLLGDLNQQDVFILALTSGIAEELFFRGFLQQVLSVHAFSGEFANVAGLVTASMIFGLVHIGPDLKKFWPWTVMAVVMGFFLGWMYLYTGNLLAPIIAHFTINFLNLSLIVSRSDEDDE